MADSGFIIDGLHYEVPSLDSFNMDEAQVLYDLSRLTLEDFAVDEDDPAAAAKLHENIKNPGFVRTLMTVAYMRGNRGISRSKAEAVIGGSNLFEALKQFGESVEADAGPPEVSRSEPEPPDSDESTASLNGHSGESSTSNSAEPAENPAPTGISESDTSLMPAPRPSAIGSPRI